VRPRNGTAGQAAWQAGLPALREFRIVMACESAAACSIGYMLGDMRIDLRPEIVVIEANSALYGEGRWCGCRGDELCSQVLTKAILGMVKTRRRSE